MSEGAMAAASLPIAQPSSELRQLIQVADPKSAIAGLDTLIAKCPKFAEAYNQRATLHCRLGDYTRSIADCARALKLNSCHFGALMTSGTVRGRCPFQVAQGLVSTG